jgi:hypothetical protein
VDRRAFLRRIAALAGAAAGGAALGACGTGDAAPARPAAPRRSGAGEPARPPATTARRAVPTTTTVPEVRAEDGMPVADWVLAENRRPGTTSWVIRTAQPEPPGIEGYLDHASAQRGERVVLRVRTVASRFRVEAYRMGWYGGTGARLVYRSGPVPATAQPPSRFLAATNTVECEWRPSLALVVGDDWLPGNYLLLLRGSGGEQRYVPFLVRDDASRAAVVVQSSVTTWQAYNLWGGYSLYGGTPIDGQSEYDSRSRVVSFDRPYGPNLDANGSGDWLGNEFPFVALAERLGLDVTYWNDVDFHARPSLLLRHRCLVSLGHDEYWSTPMRDGASQALDRGVNFAFLGANACYRQIRLAASPLGADRRVVCYKDSDEDPMTAHDPALATGFCWATDPVPWYESNLIGVMYQAYMPEGAPFAPFVVADASSFAFAGTGLRDGEAIPGLVGSEFDAYAPRAAPAGVRILAHSPVTSIAGPGYSDASWYTKPGAGGVFATGTASWVTSLWDGPAGLDDVLHFGVARAEPETVAITKNVLRVVAGGPASARQPSRPNWQRFYASSVPLGTGEDVA